MKLFVDPDAVRNKMEAEANAEKRKEEEEAAASAAELARIMGVKPESAGPPACTHDGCRHSLHSLVLKLMLRTT